MLKVSNTFRVYRADNNNVIAEMYGSKNNKVSGGKSAKWRPLGFFGDTVGALKRCLSHELITEEEISVIQGVIDIHEHHAASLKALLEDADLDQGGEKLIIGDRFTINRHNPKNIKLEEYNIKVNKTNPNKKEKQTSEYFYGSVSNAMGFKVSNCLLLEEINEVHEELNATEYCLLLNERMDDIYEMLNTFEFSSLKEKNAKKKKEVDEEVVEEEVVEEEVVEEEVEEEVEDNLND